MDSSTPDRDPMSKDASSEDALLSLAAQFDPAAFDRLSEETLLQHDLFPIRSNREVLLLTTPRKLTARQLKSLEKEAGLAVETIAAEVVDCSELVEAAWRFEELRPALCRLADGAHGVCSEKTLPSETSQEEEPPEAEAEPGEESDEPAEEPAAEFAEEDSPRPLARILETLGLLSDEEASPAEGVLDASLFIDTATLKLLPAALAWKHKVLPLKMMGDRVAVAAAAKLDVQAELEIKLASASRPLTLLTPAADLETALERCYRRVSQLGFQQMRLGEILLARGVISRQQLESALAKQTETGGRLGEVLVHLEYASEEMIYSALAEKLGVVYQPINYVDIDREASRLVSRRFAESHVVLPSKLDPSTDELVVAMANPQDLAVADLLKTLCKQKGYKLRVVISTPSNIQQGIAYVYHTHDEGSQEVEMETVASFSDERSDLVLNSEMPQIKKIVNGLLYQAVTEGASDIHIENLETRVRVRFRIDGILQLRSTSITKKNIGQVISVLKIDSGLDITERRRPQDGVFKKRIGKDWYIDFRINVHCTQFGAEAVIRILDSTKKLPRLDQLGLPEDVLAQYIKLVENPQGLILITGPTGSGKSTTLYSTLSHLNLAERKIVTAEDPIEYHLDGICQYQVNEQIGNTFAEYSRRFLRKDPDIILIGETRDEVTAESCLRAAMTGHLVFSTLHTNHAIGAVARLRDLGVDASSICDGLLAVIAQRLVRRNCQKCIAPYTPNEEMLEDFYGGEPPEGVVFCRGAGCSACHHTGYRDRIGVYEFWQLNREARNAILSHASEERLLEVGRRSGLRPLVADAVRKVQAGVTTLEELRRVVPMEQIHFFSESFNQARRTNFRRPSPKIAAVKRS